MEKILTSTITRNKKRKKKKNRWQVSVTVLILFIIGSMLNIPFSREVKRLNIEAGKTNVKLNDSIIDDLTTTGMSSLILGTILVLIGLWISSRANMGALLSQVFFQKPTREIINRKAVFSSILFATVIAIILLGLFEIQKNFIPFHIKYSVQLNLFYFLVSFSAGITEEIMFSWV